MCVTFMRQYTEKEALMCVALMRQYMEKSTLKGGDRTVLTTARGSVLRKSDPRG
jgi:hypothetical protein